MNIGILIIATNKYTIYVNPLVESINKYFLPNHNKTIFVFTNKLDYKFEHSNIITVPIYESLPWPMPTLKRYEIFYKNKESYKDMNILYYLDVDMLIHDIIDDEILPIDKDLIAVIHPGYLRDKLQSFERNQKSTACVDYSHHTYHCGGIQGGKKDAYLNVCKTLMDNINQDFSNNIIAVWHDESHWNCYLINHPDSYKELDSSYCYPERWNLNIPKKILALDKDHQKMRS
jgi:histo-blood group ABO system transferase